MEMAALKLDTALSGIGTGCYLCACLISLWSLQRRRDLSSPILMLLFLGVLLFGGLVTESWLRVGHGPFVTLYELILSNLFSLGFIYLLAFWRVPALRSSAPVVLVVLITLGAWLLAVPNRVTTLPTSFFNPWLWVHVGVGKVFLGSCLVSAGVASVLLLRHLPGVSLWESDVEDSLLELLAWRALAVAFLFHSMMLIAGSVWAQDAWGRFWNWDPLETWSFLTWLAMAILLHMRASWRLPKWVGPCGIIGIFVLAFLTFFGLPFISTAAHKGVV